MPLQRVVRESELRALVADWRQRGETIALVPTMGALHPGHLALVERARSEADRVIVSIFVNPEQFGPDEDFNSYPRQPEEDVALLEAAGADAVWLPTKLDIYPPLFVTRVKVSGLGGLMCGEWRPSHFEGVATVVTILLQAAMPDVSIFGMKDFQQLVIIRHLHANLRLPGRIVGCETVREADGLALSSRNRFLSPEERAIAPKLREKLLSLREKLASGENWSPTSFKTLWTLTYEEGFRVEYLDLRRESDLGLLNEPEPGGRMFIAAWLGKTRLIDNLEV